MAPPKSYARNATATPARSTRANSAIPVEDSGIQRSTRAATQQPGTRNLGNLREVELQQSYGYGSKAAVRELDRLGANKRTSKGRTAGEIDDEIEQAKGRFDNHVVQTKQSLETGPPATRTRRKTSREPSREPSLEAEKSPADKTARVRAWADSLESDQLEEIPEEGSEESEGHDDRTRKDTDPSSFPSGIFDASYNFERGTRKPIPQTTNVERGSSIFQRVRESTHSAAVTLREKMIEVFQIMFDLFQRTLSAVSKAILEIPESAGFATGVKALVGASCMAAVSVLFCFVYSRFLCDPGSTSVVSQNLQKLCGTCTTSESMPLLDLSGANQPDITKVSANLQNLQKQIQLLESRLTQRFDSQQSILQSEVDALKQKQIDMSSHLANIQIQQSPLSGGGIASPLLPKINFFAPSNGAVVDPRKTSPTKAKPQWFASRFFMRALQIKQTISKDPTTALEPWHDVGDCWCAASSDNGEFVRLHITAHEYFYPTEIVVEHFPVAGTRNPDTAPRNLELWADLSHLSLEEQEQLEAANVKEHNLLDPCFALLGTMQYDASPEVNHVQAFTLNVNQQMLSHSAKTFILRVTSTYGAEYACLYRVRLHGVPMHAGDEGTQKYY